jgi:putative membrane protein
VLATAVALGGTAVPASAAAAKAPSVQDVKYLQTSAAGDLFEIQGGKVAVQKAQTATVRAYAQKLVTDHTKSLADTRTIAKALGITLPTRPLPMQRQEIAETAKNSGMAFDTAYLKLEITDHFGDIAGGIKEVERGSNARIKANAAEDLPVLRYHLWRGQLDARYLLWLGRS